MSSYACENFQDDKSITLHFSYLSAISRFVFKIRDRKSKSLTTRHFFIKFYFLSRRFCSTRRMFMIRRALHSPDPGAPPEKLKHGYRMCRKFF